MGAGSRSDQVAAPFPFGRVVAVWMVIMLAETVHGAMREIFIAPALGDLRARQLGVLIGSLIILAIAWTTARWMRAPTPPLQLKAGATWVALTLMFEISLGLALGLSAERIFSDYNPARGGFMALGLVFMFFAPRLAAKMRRI
jgi:hypothetical protein